ncbi:MAG TPA: hypothetical protein DCS91_08255 [Microcoleaceae bacterium UBA11344]|nr:hypothetical protein [Microcoleaceae cyanobacterium UBA11344]
MPLSYCSGAIAQLTYPSLGDRHPAKRNSFTLIFSLCRHSELVDSDGWQKTALKPIDIRAIK